MKVEFMVDVNSWIVPCKNCGMKYNFQEGSKIKILSLEQIELEEEPKCPSCGNSNSIAILKDPHSGY
jgi:transcription elongation factor Elf1